MIQPITDIIDKFVQRRGIKDYYIDSSVVRIETPNQIIDLGDDIYWLTNQTIDAPQTARIELFAPNQYKETSKTDFEKLNLSNSVPFMDYMIVDTKNYGITFVPYTLEFLRVIPTY